MFPLSQNEFKSNRIVQNLLAKGIYLSDDKKNLKKSFEAKLQVFYDHIEQLEQNINVTQMGSHNHDFRLERLNYKGEIQTLEKEIHSVNEAFRHLNVSLDSIQRMTDEKNAENNELRLKLSQIKEYLKKVK